MDKKHERKCETCGYPADCAHSPAECQDCFWFDDAATYPAGSPEAKRHEMIAKRRAEWHDASKCSECDERIAADIARGRDMYYGSLGAWFKRRVLWRIIRPLAAFRWRIRLYSKFHCPSCGYVFSGRLPDGTQGLGSCLGGNDNGTYLKKGKEAAAAEKYLQTGMKMRRGIPLGFRFWASMFGALVKGR